MSAYPRACTSLNYKDREIKSVEITQEGPDDYGFTAHVNRDYPEPKDYDWLSTSASGFKSPNEALKAAVTRFRLDSSHEPDAYQRMVWVEIDSLQRQIRVLQEKAFPVKEAVNV